MVSNGNCGHERLARSFKSAAVPHGLTRGNPLQQCDARVKRHHRLKFLIAITGRKNVTPQSIEHAARTDHVSPGCWLAKDAGRIRKVTVGRLITTCAKSSDSMFKTMNLTFCERRAGRLVCGSKVSHQTVDANVFEPGHCVSEISYLIESNTEPPHAGINLDVNVDDFTAFARSQIEGFDHVESINSGNKFVLNARLGLSLPEPCQTENRLSDP